MMRLRGSFGAEMEFRRFPFDRQALEFIIRAPANMPRNALVLLPKAKIDPSIFKQQNKSARQDPDGKDVIGGWRVVHMAAQERSLLSNTTTWDPDGFDTSDSRNASDDPLFALMDSFCVYCLDHTNWLVAIVFTGGYVIMMTRQFKDASWHEGAHICE